MRNDSVKLTTVFLNNFFVFFALNLVHQFLKDVVASFDGIVVKSAQRHFFDIVTDLDHLVVHHIEVKNELYQFLHWSW